MSSDDDVTSECVCLRTKKTQENIYRASKKFCMMNVILFSECGHRISWAYYCTTLAESLGYDTPLIN
jgi:hypothetical protein